MSADWAFQGDFEFINLSASSPSTVPHRGKVLRHVQMYRRQRKSQQPRRLLESSKFHNVIMQQKKKVHPETRDVPENAQLMPQSRVHLRQMDLPSVLELVLLPGNSDPFNSMPQALTATVNNLLTFERDCVYPTVQRMEFHILRSEYSFSTTWYSGSRGYLYDGLAVYGYLSRIAATMYMVTGTVDYLETAYRYRYNAVNALQLYLQDSLSVDVIRLFRALLILLFAENALGDRSAMDKHIAILWNLFYSHYYALTTNPSFNLYEFHSVIYQDTQIAVLRLSRTFFDLERNGWIDQQFKPLWNQGSTILSTIRSQANQKLDSHLVNELRCLFLDIQENFGALKQVRRDASMVDHHLRYLVVVSRFIFAIGRLINYYVSLDVDSILAAANKDGFDTYNKEIQEASACLCAIYWLRESAGFENVFLTKGMRIFTANPTIFGKLRQIVEGMIEILTRSRIRCQQGHVRLLLWILFTGASAEIHHERANLRGSPGSREAATYQQSEPRWFTNHFVSLAQQANLKSWRRCKDILEGFLLPEELMEIDSVSWCARLLGASSDDRL